jgi:DNA processing protein
MLMAVGTVARSTNFERSKYAPPSHINRVSFRSLIESARRIPGSQQARLDLGGQADPGAPYVFCVGEIELAKRKCVAIVGSRKVSEDGARRAGRLARELCAAGVVVVSGLAEGVDTAAHMGALQSGGRTIAVIGTPLNKAYPAANARLQETIYREHLLVSPFEPGAQVFKSNFPTRNKFMAALSDATVIIEASDTSGSLHQAAECQPSRLNRPLFIARSVVDDPRLTWPKKFLGAPNVRVLDSTADILSAIC